MEYRKKHLKPKRHLAEDMTNTLAPTYSPASGGQSKNFSERLMEETDFFQQLRK